jgi:hypothetical protein
MSGKSISKGYALTTAFAVLLAGTAVASVAGEAGAAVQNESGATKKDRSRRVCRVVTPTSSRLTTRICRTQSEWDESADKTGESLRKYQFDQTRQGPTPGIPDAGGYPR